MPSKKPSVAKPPERTVFFIDRSLGREPIRSALAAAGLTVELHDEHFERDESDEVWLSVVGRRKWVVLTKDQRLQFRPLEKEALRESGARVFILTAGNLRGSEIASVFVKAVPAMLRVLRGHRGPFVARVARSGGVRVVA